MIKDNVFSVIVKPKSKKTEFLGFDKDKNAYKIALKAPAQNNKANIELVRFLSKLTGKNARIKSGLKSKLKIIEIH